MRKKYKVIASLIILLGMLTYVSQITLAADTLYFEDFCTDVFESGDWERSHASVSVDTVNCLLHIGQGHGSGDYAERTDSFPLPIRVEARMRLVSGGLNYRLPILSIHYGTETGEQIDITYLCCSQIHGWKFKEWTQIHTVAPGSENVWWTVSAIIRSDGGELLAKSDSDTTFTSVVVKNWSITDHVVKLEFRQPWDAVCDIDYILVESWEPRSCSLFVGSSSTCLDPKSMMIPLLVANDDTISAMTIPLHWETDCPGFTVDSVSFWGTRIENWEGKNVSINGDTVVLGLIADMGGGTPPLPPGEGPIAYVYFSIECDPENVYDSCFIAWDTTTVQPESQHLLFVDNHGNEFIPSFAPGITFVALYRPGDVNCNCEINIGDVVYLINYLFKGGPEPRPLDAGDVNGDCIVDIGDVVCMINYLFKWGPPPVCGCASHPELAGSCGGCSDFNLKKTAGTAEVGLITSRISKQGKNVIEVNGYFGVDAAGVQLEFSYNPDEIQSIIPELTNRTKDLSLFFSAEDGILKIGIVDLNGEHLIPAGEGALVTLNITGSDLSSLELQRAILVNRNATPFGVTILPKEDSPATKPRDFALLQNHPNPFNPATSIQFAVVSDQLSVPTTLRIYNIRGQLVRTLVDEPKMTGTYEVVWDGKDDRGNETASGVYFYKLKAGEQTETKKMILMK